MTNDFQYTSQRGHLIRLSLYGTAPPGSQPCIIYIHGFKGFKDWGFVPYAGQFFANAGFHFLAFNFSHNGIGHQATEFTEFDKFKDNSLSLELEECLEVINLIAHSDYFGAYFNQPLGLLGHSRGGGIAILAAQLSQDIQALCTWASVAKFDRYPKSLLKTWRNQGYHEVTNSRTGQVLKMGLNFLNDIEKQAKKSLNVLAAVQNLEKPYLIIHGQNDETVPYFEAEEINIFADPKNTRFRLIPATGHTFGAKHPFESSNPALEECLKQSAEFFTTHLKSSH